MTNFSWLLTVDVNKKRISRLTAHLNKGLVKAAHLNKGSVKAVRLNKGSRLMTRLKASLSLSGTEKRSKKELVVTETGLFIADYEALRLPYQVLAKSTLRKACHRREVRF